MPLQFTVSGGLHLLQEDDARLLESLKEYVSGSEATLQVDFILFEIERPYFEGLSQIFS